MDPGLAVMVHAVVGGTPAYRSFIHGDGPDSVTDFDDWVLRTVLDPATPLFREVRYLLAEESSLRSCLAVTPRSISRCSTDGSSGAAATRYGNSSRTIIRGFPTGCRTGT